MTIRSCSKQDEWELLGRVRLSVFFAEGARDMMDRSRTRDEDTERMLAWDRRNLEESRTE